MFEVHAPDRTLCTFDLDLVSTVEHTTVVVEQHQITHFPSVFIDIVFGDNQLVQFVEVLET